MAVTNKVNDYAHLKACCPGAVGSALGGFILEVAGLNTAFFHYILVVDITKQLDKILRPRKTKYFSLS